MEWRGSHIGTSTDDLDIAKELEKARVAVASGADAIMDVVSRGGAFTIEWMAHNRQENPPLRALRPVAVKVMDDAMQTEAARA
jgi:thiamine biosynthesis protein ThiC